MRSIFGTNRLFIFIIFFFGLLRLYGQDDAEKTKLTDARKRLATVDEGMSSEQVLKLLGKPDEIRRLPEGHLLDGTKYFGSKSLEPEVERWAYGILGKGMFARVGIVSMDRNGKVAAAITTDCFARSDVKVREQVSAENDRPVESPSKMTCHVGSIQFIPARSNDSESIKTTITLKNAGTMPFEIKHPQAHTMRRFLLVEFYDSTGNMLCRDNEMLYASGAYVESDNLPKLSIAANSEMSDELYFVPASGCGPLPPGKYGFRVYFPFENLQFPFDKAKYYPSNFVRFEVPKTN